MNPFVILFQPSTSLRLTGRQGPHPLTDADKARANPPSRSGPASRTPSTFAKSTDDRPVFWSDLCPLIPASHPAKDYNVALEVRPWAAPTTQ